MFHGSQALVIDEISLQSSEPYNELYYDQNSFNVKYPFATHNILIRMRRHRIPYLIVQKSIKLIFYCTTLKRILSNLRYTTRLNRIRKRMLSGKVDLFGFEDVVVGISYYRMGSSSQGWTQREIRQGQGKMQEVGIQRMVQRT